MSEYHSTLVMVEQWDNMGHADNVGDFVPILWGEGVCGSLTHDAIVQL